MNPGHGRRSLALVCEVAGTVALVFGVLLGYATRSVFDSNAFSQRVEASLSEPGVSAYVAGKIADGVIAAKPDLIGLRPVIIAGGRSVVSSTAFRAAARRAALEAHRAIMSGTGEKIMLSVKDVGEILQATLSVHPDLAAKLPRRLTAQLASLDEIPAGELARRLVALSHRARFGFLLLVVSGLALLFGGVALSHDHQRTLFRVGQMVALSAFVMWLAVRFGANVVAALPRDPEIGLLAGGLWRAFLGDLQQWALGLGMVGIVFASASATLLERSRLQRRTRALWRWFFTPSPHRGRQFGRGLTVLVMGVCTAVWPGAALHALAFLLGAAGAFVGLRECFAAAIRALPEAEPPARGASATAVRAGGWSRPRIALAGALMAAVVTAAAVWVLRSPSSVAATGAISACNGYPQLCDRRLDQVVFPAAHNAMSSADDPGWMFPSQNHGITRQLRDGVRAFLLDAHYGVPVGDKVKTIMENEVAAMAKYEAALGKEGMAAALRIRDRLVAGPEQKPAVYMAHGFCELGARPLTDALVDMRAFLAANPGEILILVIQDEGVAAPDIAKCFEESGLFDFVYKGHAGRPWPTLREMAESGQRVLVMAENDTTGVAWYHKAFEVMQETPYTFHDPKEFSEKANRGGPGGSLLLMNHWIESTPMPKPSNAEIVNAYDALLKRSRRFERRRGRVPNIIAVDFYATGDLMRVVRTLNGVEPDTTTAAPR